MIMHRMQQTLVQIHTYNTKYYKHTQFYITWHDHINLPPAEAIFHSMHKSHLRFMVWRIVLTLNHVWQNIEVYHYTVMKRLNRCCKAFATFEYMSYEFSQHYYRISILMTNTNLLLNLFDFHNLFMNFYSTSKKYFLRTNSY